MFNKNHKNRISVIVSLIGLVIFSISAFIFISKTIEDIFIPNELKLKSPVSEILDSNDYVGEDGAPMVQYAYRTSEKIKPKEREVSRNNNSFTEYVGESSEGEGYVYKLTTYSGANFAEKDGEWYQLEHATTTKEIFSRATEPSFFAKLFGKKAWAATATIYSGAGDGAVKKTGTTWPNAHDGSAGGTIYNNTENIIARTREFTEMVTYGVARGFFPFDTSSIPIGADISSADLSIYVASKSNNDNDGDDWLNVVQTSQASHFSLVLDDFDQAGAISDPVEGATRIDLGDITAGAYNTWTLNATGLSWIKGAGQASNCSTTGGITCLGLREGHDAINSAVATDKISGIVGRYSEYAGTSSDPYLTITYTLPAPASHLINSSWADKFTDGLVLMQSFDGNHMDWAQTTAEARDQSGQGNHGDVIGATAAIGMIGQALSFDGDNDYVESVSNVFNPNATDFTATAWFKTNALSASQQHIMSQTDGTGTGRTWMYINGTTNVFESFLGGSATSGSILQANRWYHGAVTKSGTTITLYLDGQQDTISTRTVESATGLTRIGASKVGASVFLGNIDEVRVYNRALSADEVRLLYNLGR